jgi:hypothetical protein
MGCVYVKNKKGAPLMPCCERTARLLLRDKKARVVHRTPFTIQLLYGASGYRQQVVAGMDTGSSVVGCAATANGKVVYQAEVILRNDISKKMTARLMYRRTRRGRNTRYRQPRFSNRSASTRKGRLPPSLTSKINSHLREISFVESILPVSLWKLELASFDIHKISNPDVTGTGYQSGPLKDFYNVKQYVLSRDGYKCQSGQKTSHSQILHVHHKQFRSQGGSDAPDNLLTLCQTCHDGLHMGSFVLSTKAKRSKTKHATHMSIIKSRLSHCGLPHEVTFGYETKFKREQVLKWPKTHANDAVAICLEDGELVVASATMLIKQHMSKGDYKQTAGKHSQLTVPTGKLFGLRKGDKVATSRGMGFVKGKRSTGYFTIADLDGNILHASEKVANCLRISARSTTQTEEVALIQRAVRIIEKENKVPKIKNTAPKSTSKAATASRSAPFLTDLKDGVSRSNI